MLPEQVILEACSPSEVLGGLQADPELDTFRPAREQLRALRELAVEPGSCVSTAVVAETLIGYASFHRPAPPELWSQDRTGLLLELGAIEVAPRWRGQKLAERLLQVSFAGGRFDATIVFATMYVWHYDFPRTQLGRLGYRRALQRLYEGAGFETFDTSDPEISSSPANALMARIGSRAPSELRAEFDRLRFAGSGYSPS